MPQDKTILLEDVRIIFRNFEGREGMYNRAGDRNFAVLLPRDIAEEMVRDGWNVKLLKAREEGEEDQPYISVSVSWKGRPPTIKMITSRGSTDLDEDSIEVLDNVDIASIDMILNPYDWVIKGSGSGRKAYLQSMYVTIVEDALALKYNNTHQIATVDGPMREFTEPMKVDD